MKMKTMIQFLWDGWVIGMGTMALLTRLAKTIGTDATFGWQGWSISALLVVLIAMSIFDVIAQHNKEKK